MRQAGSHDTMQERSPAAGTPTVSIIIPTMQRRVFLEETLLHLARTDYPRERLEVFIVDGESSDGSHEVAQAFEASSGIRLRWHADRALKVSAARNYAIQKTDAELLVFLDDDCITKPGWVRALIAPLLTGEVDLAGGTDQAPPDDPFMARCEDVAFSSFAGSGGVRGGGKLALTGFCPMTCNMAMARDKMIAVGSFDERLRAVEDTEFVYRSRKLGLKVAFVPEATVLHRRRAGLKSIRFHNYIRGYGRTYLWRRYPEQRQYAFFLPALGLLQGLLLAVLALFFPVLWLVLAGEILLYGLLLLAAGVQGVAKVGKAGAFLVVPFLVAIHHLWYAFGILHGPLTGYRKLFATYQVNISDPFGVRQKRS